MSALASRMIPIPISHPLSDPTSPQAHRGSVTNCLTLTRDSRLLPRVPVPGAGCRVSGAAGEAGAVRFSTAGERCTILRNAAMVLSVLRTRYASLIAGYLTMWLGIEELD